MSNPHDLATILVVDDEEIICRMVAEYRDRLVRQAKPGGSCRWKSGSGKG
jgi:hypothetical protein